MIYIILPYNTTLTYYHYHAIPLYYHSCALPPAVPINQIKEIRPGKNTDVLRNKDIAGPYPDECAFSIIYGESFDTMDLIANSPDEANIWVAGLTCLVSGKVVSNIG